MENMKKDKEKLHKRFNQLMDEQKKVKKTCEWVNGKKEQKKNKKTKNKKKNERASERAKL